MRARTFNRFSTSACISETGKEIVMRRSNLSKVSTAIAMKIVQIKKSVVRGGGLEPPHHYWRQDLNLVRLPISPSSRDEMYKPEELKTKAKGDPKFKCRPELFLVAF